MNSRMLTEETVKEKLGIENFRNLSKEKVVEFVSQMHNMDREVAIKIISQFPDFAGMALGMINQIQGLCSQAMEAAGQGQKEVIASYVKILDEQAELLKKENLSEGERIQIVEQMIVVADRIAEHDKEHKSFLKDIVKVGATVVGGALIVAAAILGVTFRKSDGGTQEN